MSSPANLYSLSTYKCLCTIEIRQSGIQRSASVSRPTHPESEFFGGRYLPYPFCKKHVCFIVNSRNCCHRWDLSNKFVVMLHMAFISLELYVGGSSKTRHSYVAFGVFLCLFLLFYCPQSALALFSWYCLIDKTSFKIPIQLIHSSHDSNWSTETYLCTYNVFNLT